MPSRIEQIHAFLLSCPVPVWQGECIDILDTIDIDPARETSGNMIIPVGENIVTRQTNVRDELVFLRKRANYNLIFRRPAELDDERFYIAVALPRFLDWINKSDSDRNTPNANPLLPKFSDTSYEIMSANGGYPSLALEISGIRLREYLISLHFDFDIT